MHGIRQRRERLKLLERELEQSTTMLQMLTIQQSKLDNDILDLRQQHLASTNEKHSFCFLLNETKTKLVI